MHKITFVFYCHIDAAAAQIIEALKKHEIVTAEFNSVTIIAKRGASKQNIVDGYHTQSHKNQLTYLKSLLTPKSRRRTNKHLKHLEKVLREA